MDAEVIAIGDEIVSGEHVDTNSAWLSQRLEELGYRVRYHTAVGDELQALAATLRQAVARSDVVIATGGLGPTADDLTREALALAAGRPLALDPQALEHIRGLFARRGRAMPEQNRRQALFPEGSRVLPNPQGTAPGIELELPRPGQPACRVFALPGVPAEMQEMWQAAVAPRLSAGGGTGRVVLHHRVKCFGAGESHIEALLPDLIRRGRSPRVGITASQTTITLRISAEGPDQAACRAAIEPTLATIRRCLGELVFGEGDDELQHVVLRLLEQAGQTLATAEWGTPGLLAQWLAAVRTATRPYLGGLVVAGQAALPLWAPWGEVPPLEGKSGAEPWVTAAAQSLRRHFGATYGLAVHAEHSSETQEPPRACLALAGPRRVATQSVRLATHPAAAQAYLAKTALNLVRLELRQKPHDSSG